MRFTKEQLQILWKAYTNNFPEVAPQAIDDLINELKTWCEAKGIEEV